MQALRGANRDLAQHNRRLERSLQEREEMIGELQARPKY